MFNESDISQIKAHGISVESAERMMDNFKTGFPDLAIKSAATPGDGIEILNPEQEEQAINRWKRYLADGGKVCKFVPASGAASRMFKALFEYASGETDNLPDGHPVTSLIGSIDKLAFSKDLDAAVKRLHGHGLAEMKEQGRNREIISAIISPEGLNYGALPKALLKFHLYGDGTSRTPLEEQLVEGAQTAASLDGNVNLHFTVSSNHRKLFEETIEKTVPEVEKKTGMKFHVSLSEQKPSTDTIAADADTATPFLQDGKLLFRPGGHGALIENLNDIDAEVVFIKNIDNVVPDSRREPTIRYKQIIAGRLIELHDSITKYLEALRGGDLSVLAEATEFARKELSISDVRLETLEGKELAEFLIKKFDRPLRVAGMVRNEGEPGGGPYIAANQDGSFSPQILESTQITEQYLPLMAKATHFNPVDLVCYIKKPDGRKYNLPEYVDPSTGFISSKSSQGRELRALELPGLWNGAMSDWNTVFVEVPLETFNPVKTVNDLLRPMHQG